MLQVHLHYQLRRQSNIRLSFETFLYNYMFFSKKFDLLYSSEPEPQPSRNQQNNKNQGSTGNQASSSSQSRSSQSNNQIRGQSAKQSSSTSQSRSRSSGNVAFPFSRERGIILALVSRRIPERSRKRRVFFWNCQW